MGVGGDPGQGLAVCRLDRQCFGGDVLVKTVWVGVEVWVWTGK